MSASHDLENRPEKRGFSQLDLVFLSQKGDLQALEDLLVSSGNLVLAAIRSTCGRVSHEEDLIQETYLRVCQHLSKLKDPGKFPSWLYGIAKRVALESMRRPPLTAVNVEELAADFEEPESPSESQKEHCYKVNQALTKLSADYRETLNLYYFHSKSYEEIAKILGLTLSGVSQRLVRARAKLRKILTSEVKHR